METKNELKLEVEKLSKEVSSFAGKLCLLLNSYEVSSPSYDRALGILMNLNKFYSFLIYVKDEITEEDSETLSEESV